MLLTASTSAALDYSIVTNPDPLQVDSTASITIVAAKRDRRTVSYSELTVKVSYSTDPNSASDLTADLGSITLSPPLNWTTSSDGVGGFSFTPQPGYDQIQPDDALVFVLSNISVNQQVGSTTLTLIEKATINGTPQSSSLPFSLGKFPQGFALSELSASSPVINPGDSTTLTWMGSPGAYELQYGGNAPISIPGQENFSLYSYHVNGLLETTIFNLSVTASGGTVQTQRQYTVTVVRPEILSFEAANNVTELRTGASITLSWQTVNATSCDLYINGVLIATGLPANSDSTGYVVSNTPLAPGTASFVLIAYGTTSTQSVRAVLPIFMYRFELFPETATVGPMPYQLMLRPDSARLYVACQYPYQFGSFYQKINPGLNPAGFSGLYVIDTYNLSTNEVISEYPAVPNSDPATQCITRLAINPLNTYRFYFCSNAGDLVDCNTKDDNPADFIVLAPNDHQTSSVAVGLAGVPRMGNIYPVLYCPDPTNSGETYIKYLKSDNTFQSPDFNLTDALSNLNISPPSSQSPTWMFWSIAAVPNIQLITLSLAGLSSSNYLLRATDGAVSLISIDNFETGKRFPPAVAFLSSNNSPYCVSGYDQTTQSPVIVMMNETDQEIYRIPVPTEVRAVVASPDGYHLYASLDDNSIVRVRMSTGTNPIVDTITNVGIPWALAINSEGNRLYVGDIVSQSADGSNFPSGIIRVIEISDGAF